MPIELIIPFVIIVCVGAGAPIALSLGIPTTVYFILRDIPLEMVVQRMFAGVNNFTLLAVPFFLLAGRIMNEAQLTDRIVDFAKAVTGALRGGLAMVNVCASMLFAGISGAATADVASFGAVLIPAMKKDGYSADSSAAITAISALIGPIIPPSVVFIIYGVLSGTSIIGLFLAGIVPGILFGLSQIAIIRLVATKQNFPKGQPASWPFFLKSLQRSSLSLILPLIIMGGLIAGIFTATEAGAVATFYALFLGLVVYRKLSAFKLWNALKNTALDTSNVMLLLATSTIFSWMLAAEQIPEALQQIILAWTDNRFLIFLLINIFLLLIGTLVDNIPAMIILVPVLLPMVQELGMTAIQFGVIMTINLNIGMVTPPVGVVLYLAAGIGKTTIERTTAAMAWFLLAAIGILLLVTYIPAVSMLIPHLFGYH